MRQVQNEDLEPPTGPFWIVENWKVYEVQAQFMCVAIETDFPNHPEWTGRSIYFISPELSPIGCELVAILDYDIFMSEHSAYIGLIRIIDQHIAQWQQIRNAAEKKLAAIWIS